MKRFPLYAKILLWLCLNLVMLFAAFVLVIVAQGQIGLDRLLSGSAGARLDALTNLILAELHERSASNWNPVLDRFGQAYGVQFSVFRADATQLAGEPAALPPSVRDLVTGRDSLGSRPDGRFEPGHRGRGFRSAREGRPPEIHEEDHTRSERGPAGPLARFLVRTETPVRYWIVIRSLLPSSSESRPIYGALVMMSTSLSAGGLIFDFKPWLAVGLGVVALSALFWFPLVRGITRSIAQMTHATRQIAEGHFEVRVSERRRDELGLLSQDINRMAGRMAGFISGQKRFLGDVAHELCSPLARLQVALGILEQRASEEQKPYVKLACAKAEHIANLVNDLLSFSKASLSATTIKLGPVSLNEAIRQAVAQEATEDAAFHVELMENTWVIAETDLLVRSLSNLFRNAVRYASSAGPITVVGQRSNNRVRLTVTDCGPGIPDEHLARIFDPFYRVDASRDRSTGGVGLGLSIVKACVECCGGTVTCRNRQPSGLEFLIELQATDRPHLSESQPEAATGAEANSAMIPRAAATTSGKTEATLGDNARPKSRQAG
jgi:two-component system, OmpR family, sensor histidine kinase CpxA